MILNKICYLTNKKIDNMKTIKKINIGLFFIIIIIIISIIIKAELANYVDMVLTIALDLQNLFMESLNIF